MEKTNEFNQEMLDFFCAEGGAYTYLALSEVNKGSYNVKAQIRNLMVKNIGEDNIPRTNVTDCQTIPFGIYNYRTKEVEKVEEIECKFSKPEPKREMSIYFTQKILADFQVSANDIWYVFFSKKYSYPLLGMMPIYEWLALFSEDRNLFSTHHLNVMHVDAVHLQNFRCFENVEIPLNSNYTVLVGVNGAGKTTILDAISMAICGFLSGFDGVDIKKISKDDVRLQAFKAGSLINTASIYPCGIETSATIDGYKASWKSLLNKENGNVSSAGNETVATLATMMQAKLNYGNNDVELPIIAYYGTDRLRNINDIKKISTNSMKPQRLDGYERCLSSSIDFKSFSAWFTDMTLLALQNGTIVPELEVVRNAMQTCYQILSDDKRTCSISYRIQSKEIEITLSGDGYIEQVPIRMLSDGMKSVLSMVGDIAYRMAVLNPHLADRILLETAGIVMIDEIDLHLHPAWQQNIITALTAVFPKVQFIVSTHAPAVISSAKSDNLRILSNYQIKEIGHEIFGDDANSILNLVMGVPERNPFVDKLFAQFDDALAKGDFEVAGNILDMIDQERGYHDKKVAGYRAKLRLEKIRGGII